MPCHSYEIVVGRGARLALRDFLSDSLQPHQTVVVSDDIVSRLHGKALASALDRPTLDLTVQPGENSKSLLTAGALYDALAAGRIGRDAVLIAFGGGVVGDLAGFVAATWLRGVRFIQVPTTLEAAIDASVGGKTAINHAAGKNLIGAFHQPCGVFIDLEFMSTLDERNFVAGLAESVKHAAIVDEQMGPAVNRQFVQWHEQQADSILARDNAVVQDLIVQNVMIKAAVVQADEREAGRRAILNHGHTIGHALEHSLGFELRHGECVALGMVAENVLAAGRGLLRQADADRMLRLLQRLGLPIRLPRPIDWAEFEAGISMDKKVRGGRRTFVLLSAIGRTAYVNDIEEAELRAALAAISPDERVPQAGTVSS